MWSVCEREIYRMYSTFDYSYAHRHHRKMPLSTHTHTPTEIVFVHHLFFFFFFIVTFFSYSLIPRIVYFSSESRHRNKYSTISTSKIMSNKKNTRETHHASIRIHSQISVRQEFLFSWISSKPKQDTKSGSINK